MTLVCLAPLTNVALATRTYSAFAEGLQELHIMGGNSRGMAILFFRNKKNCVFKKRRNF